MERNRYRPTNIFTAPASNNPAPSKIFYSFLCSEELNRLLSTVSCIGNFQTFLILFQMQIQTIQTFLILVQMRIKACQKPMFTADLNYLRENLPQVNEIKLLCFQFTLFCAICPSPNKRTCAVFCAMCVFLIYHIEQWLSSRASWLQWNAFILPRCDITRSRTLATLNFGLRCCRFSLVTVRG